MIPHEMIVQFWQEVSDKLCQQHRMTLDEARTASNDFMSVAEKQHFLDAVYHRNVDEIAEIIANGFSTKKRQSSGKASKLKPAGV